MTLIDAEYAFVGGYPTPETIERAYDDADLTQNCRSVRAVGGYERRRRRALAGLTGGCVSGGLSEGPPPGTFVERGGGGREDRGVPPSPVRNLEPRLRPRPKCVNTARSRGERYRWAPGRALFYLLGRTVLPGALRPQHPRPPPAVTRTGSIRDVKPRCQRSNPGSARNLTFAPTNRPNGRNLLSPERLPKR
jgi:hypothetical protein